MAIAVSTSAWAKVVKAGLPASKARITLFKRGSSAIIPPEMRWLGRAEHRKQPGAGAIGIWTAPRKTVRDERPMKQAIAKLIRPALAAAIVAAAAGVGPSASAAEHKCDPVTDEGW